MERIIAAELDAKILVKQDGKPMRLTHLQLVIKALVAHAAKGNAAARKDLVRLIERHGLDIVPPEPTPEADYRDRKALHHALGIWLERVESGGKREWLTEGEMTEALYELDSDVLQEDLPLPETPHETPSHAPDLAAGQTAELNDGAGCGPSTDGDEPDDEDDSPLF